MYIASRFDTLRFTGICLSESRLESLLNQLIDWLAIGDSYYRLKRGKNLGRYFNHVVKSVRTSITVAYNILEDGQIDYLIILPGKYCSQLPVENFRPLVATFSECKFTRADVCLDDFRRRVPHSEVKQCGELGYYRLVDYYECIESKLDRSLPPVPTCYFGNSDKKTRFYDADFIHGNGADRWELQTKNDHARSLISDYLENGEQSLPQFVVGCVDFGIGTTFHNFKRFEWWQSLINDAGGSQKLQLPNFEPCFERSLNWLYAQVAPTLAVAEAGYGEDNFLLLIRDIVNSGRKRFSPYHHALIEELKKESFNL